MGLRAQVQARSRRDHKTSEPHLFPRRRGALQKRKDTTCMPPNRPQWAYWDYAPHAAGGLRQDCLNLWTYKAPNAASSNASNAAIDKHSSFIVARARETAHVMRHRPAPGSDGQESTRCLLDTG